ncbi:methylated-DNA--[protein]-cysteine S-methyltransferase [Streptomyces sp. RPA4-5]|uniref:methylated-DNA--[protein]-cysteine S-methyltransferase n=1 Tax=Streptomyces TaxID=1883 RepID=UPI00143E8A71|nr:MULTISPECIES: methylated-DNA--[protein]-cysteine S-methyltransferase [Streptomyces]MCX4637839.1 methylated-DNA--[protein]-cysteine S-methyltransferase [Streptomyces platensis]QIY53388.1 methylated-DNA--[protein]-cysteine S-methyltransferase [Streptomyces sp. RPA4-5]WJY36038.1 methylated-DNA--[protein]-cysteine S-methyltransferase [Streptomyces sp. P9-2B-2]
MISPETTTVTTSYTTFDSPLGELLLVGEESATAPGGTALTALALPQQRGVTVQPHWRRDPAPFGEVVRQLRAYFAGELTRFELEFRTNGSEFQERIWQALEAIPYGTTTSYGRLADVLGVPRGEVRALGAAIGANPLMIVRPCHRVIGADGTMRGYAAGVEAKIALLTHEGALQPTLI